MSDCSSDDYNAWLTYTYGMSGESDDESNNIIVLPVTLTKIVKDNTTEISNAWNESKKNKFLS